MKAFIGLMSVGAMLLQTVAAPPNFEVATVKAVKEVRTGIEPKLGCRGTDGLSDPGAPGIAHDIATGRCETLAIPLRMIVAFAYGIPVLHSLNLISEVPGWVTTDRFDIEAKADEGATEAQMRLMLQTLLAQQFKLVVHWQSKESNVLALVVDNSSRLKPSKPDGECISLSQQNPCGSVFAGPFRGFHGQRVPLSALTPFLTAFTQNVVEDATGLNGLYDIDTAGWNPSDDPNVPGYNADLASSLPVLLKEELGLGLKPQKKSLNVLIIDHIEKLADR